MRNLTNAFAVKDIKSALFSQPHFVETKGVAIRSFATACEDPNTNLNKYPSDFSLYHIGTYNIESGQLTAISKPEQIANASEFVPNPPSLSQISAKHLD